MILYHTFLRFEPEDEKIEHQVPNDYQKINQNNSEAEGISVCSNEFVDLLGDGYCDDEANTEQCLYDLGDCCDYTDYSISRSFCTECFCYAEIGGNIPSLISNSCQLKAKCEDIIVHDNSRPGHGDGQCDPSLNNVDEFFDAGDCCYNHLNNQNHNQCIESNVFCDPNTMGDGLCQDYNNGPLCDYDLGDCCKREQGFMNTSECCLCMCKNAMVQMTFHNSIVFGHDCTE